MRVSDSEKSKRRKYAWAISCVVHAILLFLLIFGSFSNHPAVQPQSLTIEFVQPKATEKASEKKHKKVEKPKTPQLHERIKTNRASNEAIKTADELLKTLKSSQGDGERAAQSHSKSTEHSMPNDGKADKAPDAKALAAVKRAAAKGKVKNKQNDLYSGRSTVSYFLKNRAAIHIANPVYTCLRGGIVVVDIRVSQGGAVVEATINQTRSNTTNRCLWDAALAYAARSRFTAGVQRSQAGYITYHFQPN